MCLYVSTTHMHIHAHQGGIPPALALVHPTKQSPAAQKGKKRGGGPAPKKKGRGGHFFELRGGGGHTYTHTCIYVCRHTQKETSASWPLVHHPPHITPTCPIGINKQLSRWQLVRDSEVGTRHVAVLRLGLEPMLTLLTHQPCG